MRATRCNSLSEDAVRGTVSASVSSSTEQNAFVIYDNSFDFSPVVGAINEMRYHDCSQLGTLDDILSAYTDVSPAISDDFLIMLAKPTDISKQEHSYISSVIQYCVDKVLSKQFQAKLDGALRKLQAFASSLGEETLVEVYNWDSSEHCAGCWRRP